MSSQLHQYLLVLASIVSLSAFAQSPPPSDPDAWPRSFTADGKNITIYQPQVEKWTGNVLEERAAVGIQNASSPEPVYGVVWIKARTETDKAERLVNLQDIHVTKANLPTEPDQVDTLKKEIEQNAPTVLGSISLDRLRASLTITAAQDRHQAVGLKNDPPEIFYSNQPAVLILIDGAPSLRDTGADGIMRVINSRALILFNKPDAKYYVDVGGNWYSNPGVEGTWTAAHPPAELADKMNEIRRTLEANKLVEPVQASSGTPVVDSSTKPAELIQTKGEAAMEPIAGTELLYVTNTPDNIFLHTASQTYYVTLSGRWYKSHVLKGPWKFIDSSSLPADFAKIPETHPKGEILASVAGTPDAQEAAIANEIPQTATVDRKTATLNVAYDGPPQFQPIQNSQLQYATNTQTSVIRVSPTSYYAVENGVWFSAPTPQGPWVVATEVPPSIYSIPPSAPVYPATYVYVYGSTPDYVYTGYLPGYMGSYVTPSGVVVFGTGYYYRPWVGTYWYGPPVTFGFGVAWGFGFGWGFRAGFFGAPVYHPWWGPWGHYYAHYGYGHPGFNHMTVNHVNVYNNWNHNVIRSAGPHAFGGMHPGPGGFRPGPGGGRPGFGGARPSNNVYADKSGNVYRHDGQNWQHYDNSHQWQNVNHEATANHETASNSNHAESVHTMSSPSSVHDLDRDRSARDRGQTRTTRYAPARASGGGGVRASGGGKSGGGVRSGRGH